MCALVLCQSLILGLRCHCLLASSAAFCWDNTACEQAVAPFFLVVTEH